MELIVDFPHHRRPSFTPSPRVSFCRHIHVTFVQNLAREHKDDLWFTAREVQHFKGQMALTLRQILSSNMTVAQYAECNCDDTSVFLGLENYLLERTPREIRFRRQAICRAVSLEQQRQVDNGVYDPESLAGVAEQVSCLSRERAHIIGLLHAQNGNV